MSLWRISSFLFVFVFIWIEATPLRKENIDRNNVVDRRTNPSEQLSMDLSNREARQSYFYQPYDYYGGYNNNNFPSYGDSDYYAQSNNNFFSDYYYGTQEPTYHRPSYYGGKKSKKNKRRRGYRPSYEVTSQKYTIWDLARK